MTVTTEVPTDDMPAVQVAEEFLLGDLIKIATRRMKAMTATFSSLPQVEQEMFLKDIERDCRKAVEQAIVILAADNRVNFVASVDSVMFKEGVKAVLQIANTEASHALADCAGGTVLVVIQDGDKYLELGDALAGQQDQLEIKL